MLETPMIGRYRRYDGGVRYYKGRRQRCGLAQSPSNVHPIPRDDGSTARKDYPSLTLMLYSVRSITNKISTLQDYLVAQHVDRGAGG